MEKTIKISEEVHEMLMGIGSKGESFDQIIRRLVEGKGKGDSK